MIDVPLLFVLGSCVAACSAKVSRFPQPGEALLAESFTLEAGGKGFNLAVSAQRLGAAVDGLVAVGDDVFGHMMQSALERAGLSPTMTRHYPGQTGGGIGFTDATGETCVAVYPGANLRLSAADVRAARDDIRRAGAVLAQFEIADAPIEEAFALARQAGVATILNPSPFRVPSRELLANTSTIIVNAVEAASLFMSLLGEDDARQGHRAGGVKAVLEAGPTTLIVTAGPDGATAYRPGHPPFRQPAFRVEAVDTLGAGDAFTAAFVTSRLGGASFEIAMRRGAASGALVTQRIGVFDALPTRAELDRFLRSRSEEAKGQEDPFS